LDNFLPERDTPHFGTNVTPRRPWGRTLITMMRSPARKLCFLTFGHILPNLKKIVTSECIFKTFYFLRQQRDAFKNYQKKNRFHDTHQFSTARVLSENDSVKSSLAATSFFSLVTRRLAFSRECTAKKKKTPAGGRRCIVFNSIARAPTLGGDGSFKAKCAMVHGVCCPTFTFITHH
jgi:hypothetical protein